MDDRTHSAWVGKGDNMIGGRRRNWAAYSGKSGNGGVCIGDMLFVHQDSPSGNNCIDLDNNSSNGNRRIWCWKEVPEGEE